LAGVDSTSPLSPKGRASRTCRDYAPLVPVDVCAPITGTVWKIEVAPGDAVQGGGVVVVLESMKMEMPVEAPSGGTVTRICVQEGDAVEEGSVLVVLD
jgi:acetyl-CoA carboxylase biotin carboxyl carrier protein